MIAVETFWTVRERYVHTTDLLSTAGGLPGGQFVLLTYQLVVGHYPKFRDRCATEGRPGTEFVRVEEEADGEG